MNKKLTLGIIISVCGLILLILTLPPKEGIALMLTLIGFLLIQKSSEEDKSAKILR